MAWILTIVLRSSVSSYRLPWKWGRWCLEVEPFQMWPSFAIACPEMFAWSHIFLLFSASGENLFLCPGFLDWLVFMLQVLICCSGSVFYCCIFSVLFICWCSNSQTYHGHSPLCSQWPLLPGSLRCYHIGLHKIPRELRKILNDSRWWSPE